MHGLSDLIACFSPALPFLFASFAAGGGVRSVFAQTA